MNNFRPRSFIHTHAARMFVISLTFLCLFFLSPEVLRGKLSRIRDRRVPVLFEDSYVLSPFAGAALLLQGNSFVAKIADQIERYPERYDILEEK